MKKQLSYVVWQEGEWFIAQCRDVVISSQGHSEEEAVENLRDALRLYFTPPIATIFPNVREMEFEVPT